MTDEEICWAPGDLFLHVEAIRKLRHVSFWTMGVDRKPVRVEEIIRMWVSA